MVKFNPTIEEAKTIDNIVARAFREDPLAFRSALGLAMDLTACHCNGNPLKLAELLEAPSFDFMYDVIGIFNTINRKTGRLEGMFYPRYSVSQ